MDEIIFASATTQANAVRTKQISAVELVSACLNRIDAVNPHLNAVVQSTASEALRSARSADDALARGDQMGALHGVPMTIKDSYDTAGVITTWGTPGRANHVPDQDATVVARLRAAGAILMGKTNTPEFTLSFETDNPIYGRTSNPYDLQRSSGGSSGGAAAIVAAGGSPFDIGSDTGGSIRQPAHFCGITGIKPTSGRVPRSGHAIAPGTLFDSLTQAGPLARYVEDLSLILPLISGPDGRDPFIAPVPLLDPRDVRLEKLRGIFYTDNGIQSADAEIVDTVRSAVRVLAEAGVRFEEARPPAIEESMDLSSDLIGNWDGGATKRLLLERAGTQIEQSSLQRLNGKAMKPDEIVRLIDRWDRFRTRMLRFMQEVDLILAPVNAFTAIRHGTLGQTYAGFSYTMTYNLTGWPAAVVRAGTDTEGLPIGVQVIASPWREDIALAAASVIEAELGGWQRPPD